MKFCIIILFLILLSINVLAQEIILNREIYSPYETLQANISLNFLPTKDIQLNQIFLFDSQNKSYFIAPFLTKIDDNSYYIYFDLPYNTKEDNYTLKISKILYVLNNVLVEKTISKQFSIINDNYTISISPAIINASNSEEFYIKTINHGKIINITVITSNGIIHPYNQPQQIGDSKSFRFILNSENSQEEVILFYNNKNYTIPVYTNIIKQSEINLSDNKTNITNQEKIINPITLITNLSSIIRYLDKNEVLQGPLLIQNNLNQSLSINFNLNGNINQIVEINSTTINLKPHEIKEQYFIVNKNKNPIIYEYYGNLSITTLNYSIIFPMTFYINQKVEQVENRTEEINENLFNESEQEIVEPFENKTEPQTKIEEKSNTTLIILIIIIIIILLIILVITRKKHREKTFDEYLKTIERK